MTLTAYEAPARGASEASLATARGALTRQQLLDAAELLVAEQGFHSPSHRMIAKEANAHPALVNYHFGSKDMLFEAAIERRAARLVDLWGSALAAVLARSVWSVEDVLLAWWKPFGEMDPAAEARWGNYLCMVARLGSANEGEAWYRRHFGPIDDAFRRAFRTALPATPEDDLDAGYRYARTLFGVILLHRCGRAGVAIRPRGYRDDDVERLITYLASGLKGLSRALPAGV